MNPLAPTKPTEKSSPHCAELTILAERELSAFFNAVTQLFGSDQGKLAAEDWLHELIDVEDMPTSTREWRLMTTKVSARLAHRLNVSSLTTEPQLA
jgi:hypothetical protein